AIDIDEIIEQRERMPVADIFARHGESYFRIAERDALTEQLGVPHAVVATGGGTFVDPQNRSLINADGLSIWLDIPLDRALARVPLTIVRGNHDKVACGIEEPEGFNVVARSAALWTLGILTPENRAWLAALPEGPIPVDAVLEICHGSPFDEDAYIFDE